MTCPAINLNLSCTFVVSALCGNDVDRSGVDRKAETKSDSHSHLWASESNQHVFIV